MKRLQSDAGVAVATVTLDNRDVEWIQERVQTHLEVAQQQEAMERWRDFGYYLVFPVAIFTVFWFRRGWTVRWAG